MDRVGTRHPAQKSRWGEAELLGGCGESEMPREVEILEAEDAGHADASCWVSVPSLGTVRG